MFARIAGRYDLLNRLLSAGVDRRWRRVLVREAGDVRGRVCVDACCGTGDLAFAFGRAGARVVGVDFTVEMLARARDKRVRAARATRETVLVVGGDALRLPLADRAADVSAVAFGIRNVGDRRRGLAELARVVRPGGRVLVLEFATPRGRLVGPLYRFYFHRVLPAVGGWISGHPEAYRYLPDTVARWPSPEELEREMAAAGLVDCGFRRLTGGIACLSWGRVPAAPDTPGAPGAPARATAAAGPGA